MTSTDDDDDDDRDPLDRLAEEFLARLRRGESIDAETFAAAHAEHRDALLELLPTLAALEQLKRDRESTSGMAARVALPAMQRLGDFRIVREIGRGGMGVVFEAVQESLSRKVALKVMPQASLLTGNQLMRFQREAQFAAQLHHSNIVPVFGSGESDGYHWYAMQFIVGQGLDAWRKNEGGRRPQTAGEWRERARFVARVGEQVASALHYAHGQGTLHRDIKPANLLLEGGGHVWVTDFGLARALESEGLTQSGDLLGTLQYMAPEQFAGQYEVRSEVYALGITLYELLTLQPAYSGQTKSELMDAIRRGQPQSLRRLCPDAPGDLLTVIEKACASDVADRYATAEALQHDLQAFLDDRPIAARRQSTAGLVLRWCRRNRAMAAVGAVALVAAIGAGITGWVAYVVTDDALGQAKVSSENATLQSQRAEANLRLSLAAFGDLFDALVGRDPVLLFEEDPDTGEQNVIAPRVVDDGDVALLELILSFYVEFGAQNSESQTLRFETARAYRRVGVIQVRLGNRDEAAKAYDLALQRYQDVTDRDVTREVAAVHVEYGQLEQRNRDPRAAASRFRLALELLDREPAVGDTKALRFDRAKAHFLMAENASHRGRMVSGRRGPDPDRMADAKRDLDEARAILSTLSTEDAGNIDVRALDARCLLLAARIARGDDAERDRNTEAGLELLRGVVAEQPTASLLRYELGERLLSAEGSDGEQRLARLVEARAQADQLVEQQPGLPDYRALQARACRELGTALIRKARDEPGSEQSIELRQSTLREAEAALRVATAEPERGGGMEAWLALGHLDSLLRASGRAAEADAELERLFEVLLAMAKTPDRVDRPERPGGRFSGRGDPRRESLQRFSPEFLRRSAELRDAMPRPDRGGRERPPRSPEDPVRGR